MTEQVYEITPEQLRSIATVLEGGGRIQPPASQLATAHELREIAERLDRGETHSVIRPAYRVTYRLPTKEKSS